MKWWGQRGTLAVTLPQLYHSPSLQSFSGCLWVSDEGRDEFWRHPSSTLLLSTYPHYKTSLIASEWVMWAKINSDSRQTTALLYMLYCKLTLQCFLLNSKLHIQTTFSKSTNSDRTVIIIRSSIGSMLSHWKNVPPREKKEEMSSTEYTTRCNVEAKADIFVV